MPLRPTDLVVLSLFAVGLVLVPTALAVALSALRRTDPATPPARPRPGRRIPAHPIRPRGRQTPRRFGRRGLA